MLSGESSFIIGQHRARTTVGTPERTSKRAETVGRVDLQWGVKGARVVRFRSLLRSLVP